jgi:hypothetical protein
MPRISGFRGTWNPNRRPYVSVAADAYVAIQGETTVIGCGECRREININRYLTGISTEASVDSPPGSATVNLSVPDNDVNEFYVDGQLVIIPMMEIEIFAKGYYTIGGFPQYYRVFWGVVSSVSKSWSNGTTTITLSCRDILRWWELTNTVVNPAFLGAEGSSAGGYQLFQNQFAGANPYTVILALAREAMGDFSVTTGSFTSFKPEKGKEEQVIGSYAKDIMAYWQLKFGNIWNNLVLYGSSGQAYTFTGNQATVSPLQISRAIFDSEAAEFNLNKEATLFKIQPGEVAAFKIDVARAGDVEFFQTESQTKLSLALTAREQAGYEFYCDTTGDIIFKPPFYNLNVMPNKPVSWINDFEIIDDNVTDSEAEVVTHVQSSGNAFGGVTDWGLNDEITTPRTGVMDWHLLKRYGWRPLTMQLEWAGNPRKLFFHLLDYMDRVNSKRQFGSVTIPMRPELRMGFPIWFPKHDSFFYVQGISHNFSVGGQATTTLTLTAKRSKFIAPKNIGSVKETGSKPVEYKDNNGGKYTRDEPTFQIDFPSDVGQTTGIGSNPEQDQELGGPAILRDPKTGKLLGYPNAVMVYRTTLDGDVLARLLEQSGSMKANKPKRQGKKQDVGNDYTYNEVVLKTFVDLQTSEREKIIQRLRMYRYEAGMSNAGLYDYAHDESKRILEFNVIPADHVLWGTGTNDPDKTVRGAETVEDKKKREDLIKSEVTRLESEEKPLIEEFNAAKKAADAAKKDYNALLKSKGKQAQPGNELPPDVVQKKTILDQANAELERTRKNLELKRTETAAARANQGSIRRLASLPIMIRPVSDEFGFEVIGHYRYGRGAFIDRGQVQIQNPATKQVVNQLNIQFAAHGGLLTDNPRTDPLGPEHRTLAETFEKMQPDDYVTGASFSGGNYGKGNIDTSSYNPTSQQTYTEAINLTLTRTGRAVFAEADATRRAKTLAEMSPTSSTKLGDAKFNKCTCSLSRANWLSIFPSSFIQEILNVQSTERSTTAEVLQTDETGDVAIDPQTQEEIRTTQTVTQTIQVAQGSDYQHLDTGNFFKILNDYMVQRFKRDYQENEYREKFAISGGRDVLIPDDAAFGVNANNILTPPGGSLFDRAARGDQNALQALQNDANFNFGQTEQAVDEFIDSTENAIKRAGAEFENGNSSWHDPRTGLPTFKASDGKGVSTDGAPPQVQPPSGPSNLLGNVLNRSDSTTTPADPNNPPGGINFPPGG